jgi:hypothetical protein
MPIVDAPLLQLQIIQRENLLHKHAMQMEELKESNPENLAELMQQLQKLQQQQLQKLDSQHKQQREQERKDALANEKSTGVIRHEWLREQRHEGRGG